ncbi:MAG TPA: DMT family transporter, partial [Chitinophagaceae bacterium]|nr:DMT family transporter [Chitinophagaceae bacterium]
YEIGFGFLFLTALLPFYLFFQPDIRFEMNSMDFLWLFVLSLFCTVLGQSLALSALKKLTPFTTVLLVNLEPVYGIILAMIFYHENKELGVGFYIGISLIALSVLLHTWMMRKERAVK